MKTNINFSFLTNKTYLQNNEIQKHLSRLKHISNFVSIWTIYQNMIDIIYCRLSNKNGSSDQLRRSESKLHQQCRYSRLCHYLLTALPFRRKRSNRNPFIMFPIIECRPIHNLKDFDSWIQKTSLNLMLDIINNPKIMLDKFFNILNKRATIFRPDNTIKLGFLFRILSTRIECISNFRREQLQKKQNSRIADSEA